MTGLAVAKREVSSMLDDLTRSRSRLGAYDWEVLVPDVRDFIRRAMGEDSMIEEEVLTEVAPRLTRDYIARSSPQVPEDPAQLALFFQPEALLSLGNREVIAMADAEAPHLERHRAVLTANFQAQSSAYFGWMGYIDDRLPKLRAAGGNLADLEAFEVAA